MSETGAPGGDGTTPTPVEPPPFVAFPPYAPPPTPEPKEPVEPWVSIWSRPRATLRKILSEGSGRSIFVLAALGGIAQALSLATHPRIGEWYSASSILAFAFALGAVGGIVLLFLFSSPVALAGRLLGGYGRMKEVRVALAWALVPQIAGLLLWLPRYVLLGQEMFRTFPSAVEGNPAALAFCGFLDMGSTLLAFWAFLVSLKCVGEAHQFSAWRAFGAMLLAGLLIGLPVGLLLTALPGIGLG